MPLVYELRLPSGILLQNHCVNHYTTALFTTLLRVVQLLRYDSQLVHDMYIRVLSMVGPVPPATRNRAWEGYDVSELEPRGGV